MFVETVSDETVNNKKIKEEAVKDEMVKDEKVKDETIKAEAEMAETALAAVEKSESGELSKDEALDQPQASDSRDKELFKRTMVTLSRSEVFSSFLKSKLDETRTKITSTSRKEKEGPRKKPGTKRQAEDEGAADEPSKKAKMADGSSKAATQQNVARPERQPKLLEGAILRDYQLDGLDWLVALDVSGASGILADEMGLGKTIQVIALISFLIEVGSAEGPFLIIGPLSTVANWASELERFAPKIPVVVYYGSKECRAGLRRELRQEHFVDGMRTFPVVVTSYGIPLQEKVLRNISWRYVIVDEGHRLKNHECLLIKELRRYKAINRLLLTGTPLQNNLTELWSLLNFCLPEVIDDQYVFESWFSEDELGSDAGQKILEAEKQNQVLSTLHRILKPFVLRRVKADVNLGIPGKREVIVYAPMSPMQMTLYDYIIKKTLNEATKEFKNKDAATVDGRRRRKKATKFGVDEEVPNVDGDDADGQPGSKDAAVSKLLRDFFKSDEELCISLKYTNPFMILRKICQHPYLVAFPVIPGTHSMHIDERMVSRCGKMQVLDALLKRFFAGGHKVLIFSSFTQVLDLLEDYLCLKEYKYCRLDGSRNLEDRRENIDRFNHDNATFAFLISTRAGGLGINLVSADTVVIFDSDWNPQVDLQAQDRCHRIGQTKPVVVYRLVAGGTVDEKLVEKAESKMRLDRLVINHAHAANRRLITSPSSTRPAFLVQYPDPPSPYVRNPNPFSPHQTVYVRNPNPFSANPIFALNSKFYDEWFQSSDKIIVDG